MSLTNEAVIAPSQTVIDGLDAWRTLPIKQQPPWLDQAGVVEASAKLASLPRWFLRVKLTRCAKDSLLPQVGKHFSFRVATVLKLLPRRLPIKYEIA